MTVTGSATTRTTTLKTGSVGVPSILFFVLSAQAPLTGVVGAAGLAVALGNGAGAPGAYLLVGLVTILFAVGFTAIGRHLDLRGGFFAITRAGLGQAGGGAGAMISLLAYFSIQAAMYGLLGGTLAGSVATWFGVDLPWWLYALATAVLVYLLAVQGIELGARVMAVLVSAEVLILLVAGGIVLVTGGGPAGGSIDVAASFGPAGILAGTPAIAILFAVASMFGFESTAIYAGEAKDPRRTVPRATYLAVVLISLFFAFIMWMLISYYGAQHAQQAALDALAEDPALFVLVPIGELLGGWAVTLTEVLLITSLLAGILAFHNTIARYFHTMGGRGMLPAMLETTNRRQAPGNASLVQTVIAAVVIVLFAAFGLDPVVAMFSWMSGLAVAALVALYVLTSVAIVVWFRRSGVDRNPWRTIIAPGLTALLMLAELWLIVANFTVLTATDTAPAIAWVLLATLPVAAVIGLFLRTRRELAPAE